MKKRCAWCMGDPTYIEYHDCEWGVPLFDDQKLFEMLILEGMQAGLSWLTILKKRENFRQSFDQFDAVKIANYDEKKIRQLLLDPSIIRNRLKIEATIANAQSYLDLKEKLGSIAPFLWQFTNGKPLPSRTTNIQRVPTNSRESDQMSAQLKQQGFKFVGTTICYSFMQAVGMINGHFPDCFRYQEIKNISSKL